MRGYQLEFLLILSVVLLVGQLARPTAARWWRHPAPGQTGIDRCYIVGLAPEFLVSLPSTFGSGALPLVVYLHGAAERGTDPTVLYGYGPFHAIPSNAKDSIILVAPQCPPQIGWEPSAIAQFIEHVLETYPVDRKRIYLIGYSMGGYGTWHTAANYPDTFAAIAPIAGGGDVDQSSSLVKLPIWAFHGANDDVVPLGESERMVEGVRAAGGEPRLTVIQGAGHGIGNEVCRREDLWEWLFQQTRRSRRSPPQPIDPSKARLIPRRGAALHNTIAHRWLHSRVALALPHCQLLFVRRG